MRLPFFLRPRTDMGSRRIQTHGEGDVLQAGMYSGCPPSGGVTIRHVGVHRRAPNGLLYSRQQFRDRGWEAEWDAAATTEVVLGSCGEVISVHAPQHPRTAGPPPLPPPEERWRGQPPSRRMVEAARAAAERDARLTEVTRAATERVTRARAARVAVARAEAVETAQPVVYGNVVTVHGLRRLTPTRRRRTRGQPLTSEPESDPARIERRLRAERRAQDEPEEGSHDGNTQPTRISVLGTPVVIGTPM